MADCIPDISIIIPALNGCPRIDSVLNAIYSQKINLTFEVIVIDSGSVDDTLETVRRYPAQLYSITPEEFSHSVTRNYGARLAQATSYLVFLNQDAVPTDDFWLDNLVRSIEFVPALKAVCATELIEDKTYLNVYGVSNFVFRTSHTMGVHVIEPYILKRMQFLTKPQQRELFPFTTVCAIFDRQHLLDHPFDEKVPWGEDLYWAVRNSAEGYASGCTSLARVYHYHDYTDEEVRAKMVHIRKIYLDLFDWSLDVKNEATETVRTPLPGLLPLLKFVIYPVSKASAFLARLNSYLHRRYVRNGNS